MASVKPSAAFTVPFAREQSGRLVAPEDANRRARYVCPGCGGPVDLHAGERKRRHFHHRASSECAAESVTHLLAKELIVQAIDAWREGGPVPVFERTCDDAECDATTRQALPTKVRRAAVELTLHSGRIVDVALLGPGDLPIGAIEVHHTHEIDEAKTKALPLPWIEVEASAVCESRAAVLRPTQDHFLPWLCEEHAPFRKARAERERAEPRRRQAALRALPFRLEDFPGFVAGDVVKCPAGHDAIPFSWASKEPPWPRPPVVVARERDADFVFGVAKKAQKALPFRRHFVTVCATCGAVLEPTPPTRA